MPDDQNPEIPEDVAAQAVERTRQVITSLVERIYDTQRKVGVWEAEENDPDSEDLASFLLHIHSKISAVYEVHISGGIVAEEEEVSISSILVEAAIDMLGASRRFDKATGSVLVDKIIEQAREAEKIAKEEIASLGEFEAEVEGADSGEE